MNLLKTTLTALALGIAALSAQAQTPTDGAASTPRVDKREARQQKRIAQGAASGQLTPRETQRLEKEQNTVNKAEDKAKADGTVTAQERRRLTKMQNHASRDIHHQKHDAQTTSSMPASAPTK
ncbi:MAG: hypothetical protein HY021_00950 [Burkholderiales bacterium]|nr:hypothetical protein [Burkholderiales bacterium]